MADYTTLQQSMSDSDTFNIATDKEILYVSDSNNSSYNGRVTIDSTQLSNSGRWLDYSAGTLEIPFVIAMKSSADVSAHANAYIAALKSGHYQLIDSISAQLNNKSVIQQQQLSNIHVNYTVLSSWSSDDYMKYGDVCGVGKDSPASFRYSSGAAADGNGLSNARPYGSKTTFTAAAPLQESNEGLRKRLESIAVSDTGYGGLGITSAQGNDQLGRAYYKKSGSGADAVYSWSIIATIRLRDLHPFFKECPLLRGSQFRLDIVYNAARVSITNAAAGPTMDQTSITQLSGNTCPFMVTSSASNQPMNAWVTNGAGDTVTAEANVVSTSSPAATNTMLSSCRLYVPAYTLAPSAEQQYLELGTKTIRYSDLYMNVIRNSTSTFQQLLTNAISNPQKLVIVPVLTAAANDNSISPLQSVFDSCPGTTTPAVGISNMNVLVSGKAIFQLEQSYDWNAYLNEVAPANALMGGQEMGLTSGLISFTDFQNGYRYYVVDLSRRVEASDDIPLAVEVHGVLQSQKNCDLYCFIEYEREITIRLADGAVEY